MKKINSRKIIYQLRKNLFQRDVGVLVLGVIIGGYFVINALSMLDRNYNLQKQLDDKYRQLEITKLEAASLQLENRYFKTREYQELVARQDLGLAMPGEKVLILPENSAQAKQADKVTSEEQVVVVTQPNLNQWFDFFSGKNVKKAS